MNGWTAWQFADPALFALVILLAPVAYALLRGVGRSRVRFSALSMLLEARGGRHPRPGAGTRRRRLCSP